MSALLLAFLLHFESLFASEVIDESNIECKMAGCIVSCGYHDQAHKHIQGVEKVKITIFSNGLTKLEIEKGIIAGKQIIILGPKGYLCSIENQK